MKKLFLSITILLIAVAANCQKVKSLRTEKDAIIDSINTFLWKIPKETVIDDLNTGGITYTTLVNGDKDSLIVGFYHSSENRVPLPCDPSNLRRSTEYYFDPLKVSSVEKGNMIPAGDISIGVCYLKFSSKSVVKVESKDSKCETLVDVVPLYYVAGSKDEQSKLNTFVVTLIDLCKK